ncbi:MAG: cytochrome c oxidase assembly protein [Gemmatimonadetes bacterium]|nr:cytochrome c oxidase assembly protein [Gemmatimonadota bacterium]
MPSAEFSWTHWTWNPSTVVGVAVLGALYFLCAGPISRKANAPRVTPASAAAFGTALAVLLVALNGPIHDLSERVLFSAPMVQHLLLTLAVPPLLLAGTPGWIVERLTRPAPVRRIAAFLTRPLVAFLLPSFVLGLWHFPGPYDAALANHALHIVLHLSLLVAAGMLWWPVLSPTPALPRLHYSGQMLYLFALGLPMSLIGSLITLAEEPIYRGYLAAPRLFGLSPAQDQRLGGLIMWVPGMLVFWGAMTVVWFRWAAREADRET